MSTSVGERALIHCATVRADQGAETPERWRSAALPTLGLRRRHWTKVVPPMFKLRTISAETTSEVLSREKDTSTAELQAARRRISELEAELGRAPDATPSSRA